MEAGRGQRADRQMLYKLQRTPLELNGDDSHTLSNYTHTHNDIRLHRERQHTLPSPGNLIADPPTLRASSIKENTAGQVTQKEREREGDRFQCGS